MTKGTQLDNQLIEGLGPGTQDIHGGGMENMTDTTAMSIVLLSLTPAAWLTAAPEPEPA
jgi:hypothetical protein